MLRKLQLLTLFVAISLASFAQDWIEVSSDLPDGQGVGQISIGMNDTDALWAAAVDETGAIIDGFTHSTDGGLTWTAGTFNEGTGLSMIFAIDANTCWAIFNTGADQGLYKTTDGGAVWTKMGGVYGSSSFANVVHFFNDNDGFAQGDPIDGYYELYTTNDGGDNWNRVAEANIPAPTTGEYGITGNYSATGNSLWFGTNQGRIFYSSDKGETWGTTLLPFGASNVVQPLFKNETDGIAFRSYLDMGIEPELNVTNDGGATWTSLMVGGDMYARSFAFLPGTSGTYVGSSSEPTFEGISFSVDDGANWNDLTVGTPVQSPVFLDNETGWAGTWASSTSGILIYNGDPIGGGGGAEITEDFESYTAGGKLVEQALAQGLEYWTCWSGDSGAGGAEDATVSTEQVFTGDNSVMTDGTNDYVMIFGDKTAGKYSVDFYMYIPSGFVGYYNILQSWGAGGTGATWGSEVYFNPGGIAELTAANTTPFITFNYSYDTWFHVENIVNLNTDEAMLLIDGTEIAAWEWSIGASGGGLNQLAAMDIYAAATNGTPKFFMDDIQVIELEPAIGPANIAIEPISIDVELGAGGTANETMTISNTGVATLDWDAFPSFTMSETKTAHEKTIVDYSAIEIPEVQMTKGLGTAHTGNTDDVVTLNYDGENFSAVGLTSGGDISFGARFPTGMTNPYVNMEINELQVFVNDAVTASSLAIYGHGTASSPGELLLEQDFTAVIGWNNITLSTPVAITGGDIWITCSVTHIEGLFVAGSDEGPHTTDGDWFKSGVSWVPMHIANPDLDANWNIRAIAEGNPIASWIMVDPASGEVAGGGSDDVTVTFDAGDLTAGTYNGNIVVNSNDPDMPVTMVPVSLTVTGGPALDPPSDLTAVVVNENDVDLAWTSPAGGGSFDPEWLGYSIGDITNSIGTGAVADFDVAVRFTPADLSAFDDGAVTKINFVPGEDGGMCTYTLKVWAGAGNPTLIYSQELTSIDPDVWNEVVLDTPVPFDNSQELWFGFNCNTTAGYPAGCDDGPQVEGFGNMMYWEGAWTTLSGLAPTLTFNWAVEGYVEYAGTEMKLAPVAQTAPAATNLGTLASNPEKMVPAAVLAPATDDSKALTGFNVYRDGSKIAEDITATEYTDAGLAAGTYSYYVKAVYDEGESGPSNTESVVIDGGTPGTIAELDFEGVSDWSLTFDPWSNLDVDLQSTYGFTDITFPNSGLAMAYLAFNPDATDPPMSDDDEIQPHGGERFGAVMASVPSPGGNDDWLISPQVMLGDNSLIDMYAKSYTDQYGMERFNVGVSTSGMSPSDFTIISGSTYEEAPVAWTQYTYDLSAYDGQEVYVGIQCVSVDAFVFMVDDIQITSTVGIEEGPANSEFSIYPNPAQNFVSISSSDVFKSVKLMNLAGQVVYQSLVNGNEITINTGDIAEGLYMVQMETESGISTQKLIIE